MQRLDPMQFTSWQKSHPLAGARLRRLRLRFRAAGPVLEAVLSRPDAARLTLRLVGVEECRVQKRASQPAGRVRAFRLGYFGSQVFVDFDAYTLGAGEKPAAHDFRASDLYAAGAELWWEEEAPGA